MHLTNKMSIEEIIDNIDLSILPNRFGNAGMVFINKLLTNNKLFTVYTNDCQIYKKVYLKGEIINRQDYISSNFSYEFYNPYSKKTYLNKRDDIVKIETNLEIDIEEDVKKSYLLRLLKANNLNNYSTITELEEHILKYFVKNLKKKKENKKMSNIYNKFMQNNILDYLVKNQVPVKFYYVTGEEELVKIKTYDRYNYLVVNEDREVSAMVHKSNVVKIEAMGDLSKMFK